MTDCLILQWWGNLATCDWWDDTWLNEGFASHFTNVGIKYAEPTWIMVH